MAYITQAQLAERFAGVQWWTDDTAAGSTDTSVVSEIIALADAEIDAAAAQVYVVPLTLSNSSTAAVIRDKAGAIAGYKLASRVPPVSQDVRDGYEDALKWLTQLAAGKVKLVDETVTSVESPSGRPVIQGESATISRDSYKGW